MLARGFVLITDLLPNGPAKTLDEEDTPEAEHCMRIATDLAHTPRRNTSQIVNSVMRGRYVRSAEDERMRPRKHEEESNKSCVSVCVS